MEHRPPAAATRCRTPRRVASAAAAGSRTSRTVTPVSDMHKPYAAASAPCARRICDSTAAAGRCRTRRAGSQASERAHVTQRSFAVESCLLTRSEPAAVTAGLRDASLPPAHGAQHPPPVAPPPLPAAAARWHQAPVVAIGSPAAAALRAEERGAGRRARPRAPQQPAAGHAARTASRRDCFLRNSQCRRCSCFLSETWRSELSSKTWPIRPNDCSAMCSAARRICWAQTDFLSSGDAALQATWCGVHAPQGTRVLRTPRTFQDAAAAVGRGCCTRHARGRPGHRSWDRACRFGTFALQP